MNEQFPTPAQMIRAVQEEARKLRAETCTYCGERFSEPVELHHSDQECRA